MFSNRALIAAMPEEKAIASAASSIAAIFCLVRLKMHWLARLGAAVCAFIVITIVGIALGGATYKITHPRSTAAQSPTQSQT